MALHNNDRGGKYNAEVPPPVLRLRKLFPVSREGALEIQKEVLSLLDEVLSLDGRAASFDADTPLLGSVPELDSMAVIAVIHEIEARFGVHVPDDEIDGSSFATVGSVVDFVARLLER